MCACLTIWVGAALRICKTTRQTDTFGIVFRARNPKTGMLDGAEIAVDFAKIAEGYGAKGYTCRTSEELRAALADAATQDRACLFDIKVLPKTMTPRL